MNLTVTVYTKLDCPKCIWTKRHLDRVGITYTEVAIESDEAIVQSARELGLSTAPIVCITTPDGEHVWFDGYRPSRIDELVRGVA